MILVVDNYDSFTINLIQCLGILGIDYCLYKNDELDLDSTELMDADGILISPGPGSPKDAGCCINLVKRFYKKIPILGICLGHQIIAEALGGHVAMAPSPMHGKISTIVHSNVGICKGIPKCFNVTRYHSLVVDVLPPEFIEVAKTINDDVLMIMMHKYLPIYGIQFHPEAVMTEYGLELINNFCQITLDYKCKRV